METLAGSSIELRIAHRLAALRAGRGWTLDTLAERSGISRASLSRIERGELSPTAAMLNALCAQFGWTISRLMAEAESDPPSVVPAAGQVAWQDPATGYLRRAVSPPHPRLRAELIEVSIPPGAVVSYDVSPMPGLEHHLWMLDGSLDLEVEGALLHLSKGDCARYVLSGPSRFTSRGKRAARYLLSMVRP